MCDSYYAEKPGTAFEISNIALKVLCVELYKYIIINNNNDLLFELTTKKFACYKIFNVFALSFERQ